MRTLRRQSGVKEFRVLPVRKGVVISPEVLEKVGEGYAAPQSSLLVLRKVAVGPEEIFRDRRIGRVVHLPLKIALDLNLVAVREPIAVLSSRIDRAAGVELSAVFETVGPMRAAARRADVENAEDKRPVALPAPGISLRGVSWLEEIWF